MSDLLGKQRKLGLAQLLMDPASRGHTLLVVYAVYKTLEVNGRLTLNQLRHLLLGDLLLNPSLVEGAVGVLSSKSVFNCLSMHPVKMSHEGPPNFYLDLKENPDFLEWVQETEEATPELLAFEPPLYKRATKVVA